MDSGTFLILHFQIRDVCLVKSLQILKNPEKSQNLNTSGLVPSILDKILNLYQLTKSKDIRSLLNITCSKPDQPFNVTLSKPGQAGLSAAY